jgi:hypothetical protein
MDIDALKMIPVIGAKPTQELLNDPFALKGTMQLVLHQAVEAMTGESERCFPVCRLEERGLLICLVYDPTDEQSVEGLNHAIRALKDAGFKIRREPVMDLPAHLKAQLHADEDEL